MPGTTAKTILDASKAVVGLRESAVSILVVDDDQEVRGLLVESLTRSGYKVRYATSAEDAISRIRRDAFDLVLSDVKLPGMDGIALSRILTGLYPHLPVVLLTGYAEVTLAREAIQHGASDFLTKPIQLETLSIIVERNLERRKQEQIRAEFADHRVRVKTVQALAAAIDARQSYTAEHSRRVADIVGRIGLRISLTSDEVHSLQIAALIHDVGKIGIPDAILNKEGALSPEEWVVMREHPAQGEIIIGQVEELCETAVVVRSHHERVDGKGYPDGLDGESIPLYARIIAVADAFECMTSDRVYRPKMDHAEAIRRLRDCSGTQFDSSIVETFCILHAEGEFV